MNPKYLIKGIIKSIPGIERIYEFSPRTGGTDNPRYCYSVWLRHLVYSFENGWTTVPKTIAELGPGESLGVGIAGLISGAEEYFAFDIKRYNNSAKNNLEIFDELIELFRQKHPIPGSTEFPKLKPFLGDYSFPDHIFNDEYLEEILNEERLGRIRNSITLLDQVETLNATTMITYMVPWNDTSLTKNDSVDMIFSQGVLHYISDLQSTFEIMYKWLKPKGLMSHLIPFISLDLSDTWYGHWEYSDLEWNLIKGRSNIYSNREPYSTYIKLLHKYKMKIVFEKKIIEETKIERGKLASRFKEFTSEDITISSLFIQATK